MTVTERPPTGELRTRVFDVLAARGISQRWLARQIGISDTMITHIKAGRRPPTERFVEGAVRALGLPFDVLFYAVPSPSGDEPASEGVAA